MLTNRVRGAAAALAAGALVLFGAVTPVAAGDAITTQPWLQPTGLDKLRAAGYTGEGVTIAVLDAGLDPTVPELRGADITVVDPCGKPPTRDEVAHGTNVMSILASPDYGWAPRARFRFYVSPSGQNSERPAACRDSGEGEMSFLLHSALNDGAEVITTSVTGEMSGQLMFAVQRASDLGVPVVMSAGNEDSTGLDSANLLGVVAVGALDNDGKRAAYSNFGPGLTIMAPGGPMTSRGFDQSGAMTRLHETTGTSNAAPMVAGALALAKQGHPDANGNQLVRTLIATAGRDTWDEKVGWGAFSPVKLVNADPSGQPTDNVLMDKRPRDVADLTDEQVADYRDGLLDPFFVHGDASYIYRGTDATIIEKYPDISRPGTSPRHTAGTPEPTTQTTPTPGTSPGEPGAGPAPAVYVAGAAVVLGGAAVLLVALRRRNRA